MWGLARVIVLMTENLSELPLLAQSVMGEAIDIDQAADGPAFVIWAMAAPIHSAATHHRPFFVTAPGETDLLLIIAAGFLLLVIFVFGIYFMRLYWIPARRSHKVQYEFVAFLALLGLLTFNHYLWIAALLLALVQVPDFSTPLNRMSDALAKLANAKQSRRSIELLPLPEPAPLELRAEPPSSPT
jgi:hypothetical protein